MKALILGGRNFLGRHIVDSCLKADFEVTLFNRGKSNPHLYSNLETIIGDRAVDLEKLDGRSWDVVFDTSGYEPANLVKVAKKLSDKANHYIFISSCSVYDMKPTSDIRNEEAQIVNIDINRDKLEPYGKDYGACKYLCERAIDDNFSGGSTHIRAGLIVGPYDSTSRFPYWAHRLSRGGDTLAPPADYKTQFIDGRDLADWCVHLAQNKIAGVFNAIGPREEQVNIKMALEVGNKALGNKSNLIYASEEFLAKNEVQCWTELPLWVEKEYEAFLEMDSTNAISNGLKFRSMEETFVDTAKWLESESVSLNALKFPTLDPEKEKRLLSNNPS